MVSQGRAQRISRRIKEEMSEMLLFDVSDPRLQGVFVSDVKVDRELAYASVCAHALTYPVMLTWTARKFFFDST